MYKCMEIDIENDKALSIILNVSSLIIATVMIVLGCFKSSIVDSKFFADMTDSSISIGQPFFFIIALLVLVVCHEALHGCFMKLFGAVRLKYGLNIKYAYMGCDHYFSKNKYICISLAPVVIISIILVIALFCVPKEWTWFVYLLLSINIAGALGDLYVFHKVIYLPDRVVIKDTGLKTTAYIYITPNDFI